MVRIGAVIPAPGCTVRTFRPDRSCIRTGGRSGCPGPECRIPPVERRGDSSGPRQQNASAGGRRKTDLPTAAGIEARRVIDNSAFLMGTGQCQGHPHGPRSGLPEEPQSAGALEGRSSAHTKRAATIARIAEPNAANILILR